MKKLVMFFCLLTPALGLTQQYSVDLYQITGGGGSSSGTQLSISGSIGQFAVGSAMTGGSLTVAGGFWVGVGGIGAISSKGTPVLTWTNPASIIYGTALGANQLSASANVPGSFAYNPASGAVLNTGTNILSVTFTPTDTANFNSVTGSVSLVVMRAALSLTANSATRLYGLANPGFTGTLIGLTNGDNITAAFSCSAQPISPPGSYPIVASLVDPNSRLGNYTATINNGTLVVIAPTAGAQPYASGLTNSGGTIKFILNDNADSVKVAFDNGTVTNDLGALVRGINSFSLGTHTNYSIAVSKFNSGAPAQASGDANSLVNFASGRGVAVNLNAKTRNFGRVYVVNTTPGTSGGRTVGRGLYILNADQSDALGRGDAASTAGVIFSSSSASSPSKCGVGPDDMVYVNDFASATATTWMFDPDVSVNSQVLSGIGVTANPTVHTDSSGTPVVRGSLAAGNLQLFNTDGQMFPYNSIVRWNIGAGPLPWNVAPAMLGNPGITSVQDVTSDMDIGPDGKFYTSENRVAGTDADSVRVFAPDGVTLLWGSLTALGSPDPLRQTAALMVSPDGRYLALEATNSQVTVLPLTNGIPNLAGRIDITITPLLSTGRDVAWDAADNLYAVSSGQQLLRVYSLGLATTTITSNDSSGTNGSFQLNLLAALPPYLGISRSGSSNLLVWTAVIGQKHQLQYRTNLTQSVWVNLGGVITATNTIMSMPDSTNPDRQRFYRVLLVQ